MSPALSDFAVMQHEDHIGIGDRAQPVRDGDRRSARDQHAQGGVNLRLDLAVDGASRLVQQQQRSIGCDRSGEG